MSDKKQAEKRAKKAKKKGDKYGCDVCGLVVTVDEACGCDACDIICCGQEMMEK